MKTRRDYIINCGHHGTLFGFGQLKGFENLFIAAEFSTRGHPSPGGVAILSGYCWHVDHEVFVRYWQPWHVYSSPDDTFFRFCLLAAAVESSYRRSSVPT
jgi:hypothetical protein